MPVPSDLIAPAAEGTRPVSSRLASSDRLQARPNHAWFYVFYADHPGNWFVGSIEAGPGVPDEDVGDWWLPKLQTESVIPGVNHHRTLKRGQPPEAAYDDAHRHITRAGGVILDQSLGYMREVNCVDPRTQREGTLYIDVWSKPRAVTRRGKRMKFDFDRQRFYRWLLALMRSGDLPLPDATIIDERVNGYAQRVTRVENEPEIVPGKRAERVAKASGYAEKVADAKMVVEDAPTPKAVRQPAKKKE